MSKNTQKNYYQLSSEQALKDFNVEPKNGLRETDIKNRQQKYGKNILPEGKKFSAIGLFFSQFKDVLIIILIFAATVSLAISFFGGHGSPTEALLIYFIVLSIAIVGFLNEYKAEKTVEALKKLVSQTCRVRRDGEIFEIEVSELVPGDILLLEEGNKIAADARLLEVNHLKTNEANLTGESVTVSKHSEVLNKDLPLADQLNMVFSGTLITTGTATAVVVQTGASTQIGRIAKLVSEIQSDETPMQKKLDDLGRKLGFVVIGICVIVFFVVLFFNKDLQNADFLQRALLAFTAAVALAVAAIPEGLAFVVRISLALGARRMATKKALVRRLSAVESLGSTDVVCSDKTGTLTKGEMTVRQLLAGVELFEMSGSGYEVNGNLQKNNKKIAPNSDVLRLCEIGLLCNNSKIRQGDMIGDPTEGCLLISAAKVGLNEEKVLAGMPRVGEVPFSSDRKMMSTLHETKKGYLAAVKGAPDVLIKKCTHILKNGKVVAISAVDKKLVTETIKTMAAQSLRVLGFAYREFSEKPGEYQMERNLVFAGLQGMMDPPRAEVKEVIERVQREAGVRVIMITGDNVDTACAVAAEIGITGDAITGLELDKLTETDFKNVVEKIGIYARVNPEHKIRIVEALKHHGHQVAMTGDGVNDAPAIKAADIGIAMGITGTDAAKEASDMILLDDQFLTIINAVEEGRGIYDNVRKFVNFLLSCNIAEVVTILLGILVHGNLLLTAAQLLFINIVTDGLPAVALGSDPSAQNVMKFKPSRYQGAIVTRRIWAEIIVFGILMSIVILLQYNFALQAGGALLATSAVFMGMVVYEFVRLVDIRTDYPIKWFSNPLLTVSMLVSLAIQLAILYIPALAQIFTVQPITGFDWLLIVGGSVILFVIMKLLNPIFDLIGPENKPIKQV
ncbi:MAG TPA: calcium-translocating P-type ATPase, PMCA-type [Candidatus Saccharimonadales bacterium]|nr:calcium-translocating P-type ATPase, PMCA-type [Candidatus Saccharimonadales bacterium]